MCIIAGRLSSVHLLAPTIISLKCLYSRPTKELYDLYDNKLRKAEQMYNNAYNDNNPDLHYYIYFLIALHLVVHFIGLAIYFIFDGRLY